ncbi:MAG: 3-hydroxyacyl-ACP dehydratase FabZ [Myxococcota bacterium]|nr:3-hydroxyacyl-ACP dehydratase FabZ [Myxococcota bacterium]
MADEIPKNVLERPLEHAELAAYLPQRWPFSLVDRVLELSPGKRVLCVKCVTATEPFFPGHFPDGPVFPGVLLVEAIGQALSIAVTSGRPEDRRKLLLGAIREARFLKPVLPGDRVEIEATVERMVGDLGMGRGVARVDGQVVAKVELSFATAKS